MVKEGNGGLLFTHKRVEESRNVFSERSDLFECKFAEVVQRSCDYKRGITVKPPK